MSLSNEAPTRRMLSASGVAADPAWKCEASLNQFGEPCLEIKFQLCNVRFEHHMDLSIHSPIANPAPGQYVDCRGRTALSKVTYLMNFPWACDVYEIQIDSPPAMLGSERCPWHFWNDPALAATDSSLPFSPICVVFGLAP